MFHAIIIALAGAAFTTEPRIETTDDNGLCLSAAGLITVATLDKNGKEVSGSRSPVVPKADLDAAMERITALETQVGEFDGMKSELKRVEGVLNGLGVKFDNSSDELTSIADAADEFKDAISDLVDGGFALADEKYASKSDVAAFAPKAVVSQQIQAMGTRLSQIQALVEKSIKDAKDQLPRCPDMEDPKNGNVGHQYDNAGGDHPNVPFVPGVTIHYECDSGFGIKGATFADKKERAFERICYADGTWASVADKSKFVGAAECVKCEGGNYKKIDHTKYYSQTEGARWGNRDFRSGNPGETTYWTVGPVAVTNVKQIKFEWEYVVGYSWNCGWAKGGGFKDCSRGAVDDNLATRFENGPVMDVYLVNNDNEDQKALFYSSGTLYHYPYDNCGANGGWGDVDTKNDGCYSPAVTVESVNQGDGTFKITEKSEGKPGPIEAKTRKETYSDLDGSWLADATQVQIQFKFSNNQRNLHMNPHHLDLQIQGDAYDPINRACSD